MSHYTRGEVERAKRAAEENSAKQKQAGEIPYQPVNNSHLKGVIIPKTIGNNNQPTIFEMRKGLNALPGEGLIPKKGITGLKGGKRRRSRGRMTRRRKGSRMTRRH